MAFILNSCSVCFRRKCVDIQVQDTSGFNQAFLWKSAIRCTMNICSCGFGADWRTGELIFVWSITYDNTDYHSMAENLGIGVSLSFRVSKSLSCILKPLFDSNHQLSSLDCEGEAGHSHSVYICILDKRTHALVQNSLSDSIRKRLLPWLNCSMTLCLPSNLYCPWRHLKILTDNRLA